MLVVDEWRRQSRIPMTMIATPSSVAPTAIPMTALVGSARCVAIEVAVGVGGKVDGGDAILVDVDAAPLVCGGSTFMKDTTVL